MEGLVKGTLSRISTRLPCSRFWRGRRVLLTGHTGFKGAWLAYWLNKLGASVEGVALAPSSSPSLSSALGVERFMSKSHLFDIRDARAVRACVQAAAPDIVLHLAAQALVRESYHDPLVTWSTNVIGTAAVLEAVRAANTVKAVVVVTTDKVYRNREWVWPYREEEALGGHDPYAASKAATELLVDSYRSSFFVKQGIRVATARAGNVIGGGDWSADRLLPDAVRAWSSGAELEVRMPGATRPWQHVLEPLAAYLVLAEDLMEDVAPSDTYNFGPPSQDVVSVRTVIGWAQRAWPDAKVKMGDGRAGPHEAGRLALDPSRAAHELNVYSRWSTKQAVDRTMRWYRGYADGVEASLLCERDLLAYLEASEAMSDAL